MTEAKAGLPSRKLALEILLKIDKHDSYSNLALNAAFRRKTLSERDRAFVTALVQGVMRNRLHMDDLIGKQSKIALSELAPSVINILRLAYFQLEQMPDIPPSAVINLSAELAKSTGHKGHVSFVNGVLRNYLRKNQTPESAELSENLSTDQIALNHSVPTWIFERWIKNFGAAEAEQLLKYATSTPNVVVRTCETAITADGLQTIFENKKVAAKRGQLVDSCFIIEKMKGSPEKLPGYSEGLFSVQDESSAFASLILNPQKGDQVVDLCAAPGGKALHIAELLDNTGRVVAVDKSETRLNLLKKNRTRLGLKNIETATADGREYKPKIPVDRILIDAPCTGTGVINRRADLRYRKEDTDIQSLVELQRQLLINGANILKPGGVLVYSTCSIEPEENFENIKWFLDERADFEADDFSDLLPASIKEECAVDQGPLCKTRTELNKVCMLQLLPTRHGVSGFFVARLKKKLEPES